MKKIILFILITMTIFALLFVVSFISYRNTLKELGDAKRKYGILKDLVNGDIVSLREKLSKLGKTDTEIDYYINLFSKLEYEKGRIEYENKNYTLALEHFKNTYELSKDPRLRMMAIYYMGKTLNTLGKYEEALRYLKIFLENRSYPIYREGLLELAVSANALKNQAILKKIEDIFKTDRIYYEKFREVIK